MELAAINTDLAEKEETARALRLEENARASRQWRQPTLAPVSCFIFMFRIKNLVRYLYPVLRASASLSTRGRAEASLHQTALNVDDGALALYLRRLMVLPLPLRGSFCDI